MRTRLFERLGMTSTSIQTRGGWGRRRRSPPGHDSPARATASGSSGRSPATTHSGQIIAWRNGQTTGYTAVLGLALQHHKAVVVCSDVARVADNLRNRILA